MPDEPRPFTIHEKWRIDEEQNAFRTKTGKVLTDADIEALSDEAERGYPVYTCECCGFSRAFVDAEAAFDAGWDAPPHFHGYVSCDLCLASYIVLNQTERHAAIHERWEREGRPAEFSQDCVVEEDRVPEPVLQMLKDKLTELFEGPRNATEA